VEMLRRQVSEMLFATAAVICRQVHGNVTLIGRFVAEEIVFYYRWMNEVVVTLKTCAKSFRLSCCELPGEEYEYS
jgi:hypothetical protein